MPVLFLPILRRHLTAKIIHHLRRQEEAVMLQGLKCAETREAGILWREPSTLGRIPDATDQPPRIWQRVAKDAYHYGGGKLSLHEMYPAT